MSKSKPIKQLAMICTKPVVGIVEGFGVGMSFEVRMLVGRAAIVFDMENTEEFILTNHIANSDDLLGKPCVVESGGLGCMVKFIKLLEVVS